MRRFFELGDGNPRGLVVWWAERVVWTYSWQRWVPFHYRYSRLLALHRLNIGRLCIDWRLRWV